MPISEKRSRLVQVHGIADSGMPKTLFSRSLELQLKAAKPEKQYEANNIRNIIISHPSSDRVHEEIFACLNRLEERIDGLEQQMRRHVGNSRLVEDEISRIISGKWESLSRETDECLTRMMGEMQDLRDIVIGLRSSVRGMEK